MNKIGEALVVGGLVVAGYLAGFYEMKYRVVKALLEVSAEKMEESQK